MVKVPAGTFCTFAHAILFANSKQIKKNKKAHTAAKREFKANDRSKQLKLAQAAFNAFIRERDKGLPCISCGTTADVVYCAGHFRTRGGAPQLRFNQFNVHKQCNKHCNLELSGNIGEYRINLIKKIGLDKVEWIEAQNEPLKLSVEDIRSIKVYYTQLLKRLKAS